MFIGASTAGMGDMDFSRLFAWGLRVVPHLPFISYTLQPKGAIGRDEKRKLYTEFKIEVVEYGDNYADLGPFLKALI